MTSRLMRFLLTYLTSGSMHAGFKCPSCGAPKEKFYDLTDPDDPRNQEVGAVGFV